MNQSHHSPTTGMLVFVGPLLLALVAPVASLAQNSSSPEIAIRQVLTNQQDAWNRGDIDAFMEGYWHSDSLRFATGGDVRRGWQATLDRYLAAYPDRATMGSLIFTIYSIELLSNDHAFVFGRYTLERANDRPTGLFTLLFRRFGEKWRIVFDHTSSANQTDS